jgi:hypothetical protein
MEVQHRSEVSANIRSQMATYTFHFSFQKSLKVTNLHRRVDVRLIDSVRCDNGEPHVAGLVMDS